MDTEVKLEDVDVAALKTILRFMYCHEVKVNEKNFLEVLALSHRCH